MKTEANYIEILSQVGLGSSALRWSSFNFEIFWDDVTDFRNSLLLFQDIRWHCLVVSEAQKKLQPVTSLCEIQREEVLVKYLTICDLCRGYGSAIKAVTTNSHDRNTLPNVKFLRISQNSSHNCGRRKRNLLALIFMPEKEKDYRLKRKYKEDFFFSAHGLHGDKSELHFPSETLNTYIYI